MKKDDDNFGSGSKVLTVRPEAVSNNITILSYLKNSTIIFFFMVIIFVSAPFPSRAGQSMTPTIDAITITNTRDDIIAYFQVKGAFSQKIIEAVQNGIPTSFSFFVSVHKSRDSWRDKKISDIKITNTIKYNSLKEEYTLLRPWKKLPPFVTTSFETAKNMMCQINSLKVIPLKNLKRGKRYQIRIKAEMNRITLPLYLHHVFFFLSFWNFETDWYTMDFIY